MDAKLLLVSKDTLAADAIRNQIHQDTAIGQLDGNTTIIAIDDFKMALKMLLESNFDAVILDVRMDDDPNLSMLFKTRESTCLPVFAIGDNNTVDFSSRTIECGAQDYFVFKELSSIQFYQRVEHGITRCHIQTKRENAIRLGEDLSYQDALTRLPNRQLCLDRLEQLLVRSNRTGIRVGFMSIDLDGLKTINAEQGRDVGNRILIEIAETLKNCIRESDTAARIGGDEFGILLGDIENAVDVVEIARRIINSTKCDSFLKTKDNRNLDCSVSIGISMAPDDGDTAEALIRQADFALHRAQQQGGNRFQFYSATMNTKLCERTTQGIELKHGIETDEFRLVYQPIIDLSMGDLICLEALVRWQHPARGLMTPSAFLHLTQKAGLAGELDKWVLRTACRQYSAWRAQGLDPKRITMNFSTTQLGDKDLVDNVQRTLEDFSVDPKHIGIEVTERSTMTRWEYAVNNLATLASLGISLAVDDFGLGFSSLTYLSQLPFDTVKIDKMFIDGVATGSRKTALVKAIVGGAHGLDRQVIAEGIESEQQATMLLQLECDAGQGYYFSPPLEVTEIETILQNGQILHH